MMFSPVTSFPNCSVPSSDSSMGGTPGPRLPHTGVSLLGGRLLGWGRGRRSGAEAGACPTWQDPDPPPRDGSHFSLFVLFFLGGARVWKANPREGRGLQGTVARQPPSPLLKQILDSTGSSRHGWEKLTE